MGCWCRKTWKVAAAVTALVTLAGVLACVGMGRNVSDEFDERVVQSLGGDEQHWGERRQSREEEREGPVSLSGDRGGRSEARSRGEGGGALYSLEMLHGRLSTRSVSGYAILWEDAHVYARDQMDERSSLGRLGYRPDHWRASGGRVMPVRVLSDLGEAIKVRTISRAEARREHCDGTVRSAMDPYELTMFVPRSELVPVVSSEFDHTYEDNTIVFIPPGVVLRPTSRGLMARLARGEVEVPMPRGLDFVGLSYEVAGFPEGRLAPEPMKGQLAPAFPLQVAGKPFQHSSLDSDAQQPRWVRDLGEGSRLFLAGRCAGIIAITEDPDPFDETAEALPLAIPEERSTDSGHSYEIQAGAGVWWASGEKAGRVRSTARHRADPERSHGRLCFPLSGVVQVCHDEMDVEMVGRSGASKEIEGAGSGHALRRH